MKKLRTALFILMLLPLAAVLACLPFLPESIPAHYGFTGQVDRWGSKFETLFTPLMTLGFGLFMLAMAKVAAKDEKDGKNNERVALMTAIVSLLVFNGLAAFVLYTSFTRLESFGDIPVDLFQAVGVLTGVGLVVVGNICPKLRKNSIIGLRTKWSMKNHVAWKKSQRVWGILSMASGLGMITLSLLVKGWLGFVLGSLPVGAAVAGAAIYSYQAAKKN